MTNCSSVLLQLRFEGANNSTTFIDSGQLEHAIVVNGNARISTEQSKFGGSAGKFTGNTDSLEITSDAFALGSDDYTIEAWIYVVYDEDAGSYGAICSFPDNSDDTALFAYRYSEGQGFRLLWYDGVEGGEVESTDYLAYGAWHHVACTCSGGVVRLFCNGTKQEGVLVGQTQLIGRRFMIGNDGLDEAFFGYIGGLQIAEGVVYDNDFALPTEQVSCSIVDPPTPPTSGESVRPFPALRPTTRTYTAPEYAQLDPRYAGTISYPRLLGSKPGKARLSLGFENIPDSDAALIIASWMNSLTGLFPVSLPAEVIAGIDDATLASRIRTGQHLDWFFDGPPKQNSVIRGISSVQVELIGDISLSNATSSPTDPPPSTSEAEALLRMIGPNNGVVFTDSGRLGLKITTVGGAKLSTDQFKFNSSSAYFNENGSYLSFRNSAFNIGDSDFTIGCWLYVLYGSGTYMSIVNFPAMEDTGLYIYQDDPEVGCSVLWYDGIGAGSVDSSDFIPYETWAYVVVVRRNGVIRLFVNGVMQSATYEDQPSIQGPVVNVGSYPANGEDYYGYIGEVFIEVGNALYEDSFTIPSSPYAG